MKKVCYTLLLIIWLGSLLGSCSSNIDSLPDKPKSVAELKKLLAPKKYTTQKTGMYGSLTINDKTEIAWIDVKTEADKTTKDAAEEEQKFAIHFINDTAATVFKKDTSFTATYAVDDIPEENDKEKGSIKLRLMYADPSFSFGGGLEVTKVTFTFLVLGADEKRLLLQLPKSINRKPLISMLEAK